MDNAFKRLEQLTDISADVEYVGYLWFDNSNAPDEINEKYVFSTVGRHPFIIEGNLKAKDESHSISIRFVDGEYHIGMVDWNRAEEEGIRLVRHTYIGHGFKQPCSLCFQEAWLPEPDLFCENMETLQPAWIGFDGFAPCKKTVKEEKNHD